MGLVQKLEVLLFPRRWWIAYFSNWQKAKRNKQIRIHNLGPMTNIGQKSYIDQKSFIDNQSHFDKTVDSIVDLVLAS